MIKVLIVTDPMGEETADEIIRLVSSRTEIPISEFNVLAHHNGIAEETEEIAEKADLFLIDYGGMSWGAEDTAISQIKFACKWADDHPSKLMIILTGFTAEIYQSALSEQFGSHGNIVAYFDDPYSADNERIAPWLKTFGKE